MEKLDVLRVVNDNCQHLQFVLYVNQLCCISPTGAPSLYQVITGVGLPVTSHTKLMGLLRTTDTLLGISLSRKSGGTVEVSKVVITYNNLLKVHLCVSK